jgi:putative SOS response-associated peptidase YedK
MCGRFTLRTPANVLIRHFQLEAHLELFPRMNICPTQDVLVVRNQDGTRTPSNMRWGLVPSWADDMKIGARMINARSETAAEKPAFRTALRNRRCLIPADGFYEWKTEGKKKTRFWFRRHDESPFAFAGLWDCWRKQGMPIESCTLLTTTANELVAPLHERMPVILSPADYETWLNPSTTEPMMLSYLFEPLPADELIMTESTGPLENH